MIKIKICIIYIKIIFVIISERIFYNHLERDLCEKLNILTFIIVQISNYSQPIRKILKLISIANKYELYEVINGMPLMKLIFNNYELKKLKNII